MLVLSLLICYALNMKVLRIQNEFGDGPFRRFRSDELNDLLDFTAPTPYSDNGIRRVPKDNEYCGFLNEAQLFNWFDEETLIAIEHYGFYLIQLDVEITAIGSHQVLFEFVSRINLTSNNRTGIIQTTE